MPGLPAVGFFPSIVTPDGVTYVSLTDFATGTSQHDLSNPSGAQTGMEASGFVVQTFRVR